ncbi:histidine kinase [Catellatospora sp. TT07R-123]|nr:histidine kinase [Catellatospora sp. TT07R-123]
MGLLTPLWRAVAVFRVAALAYAAILMLNSYRDFVRPWLGWAVLALMAVWTIVTGAAYADPARRRWPMLSADMVVTIACLAASELVVAPQRLHTGSATLPMAWVAGVVLVWAISGGRRRGTIGALLVGTVDLLLRQGVTSATVNGTVLLLLAGSIMGYVSRLTSDAEERLQRATELEAATRERDRLARGIHDSVLQVLALVQRRGAEIGGEAAELGRLAGEQEATLRALVGVRADTAPDGVADLRVLLGRYAGARVTVASPATPVLLPAATAEEIAAAVGSALDNVAVHAGAQAQAWVLVEHEPDQVTVSVRDDGCGIAPGRLAEAADAGRLGVAQSIRGRVRDLGGTVAVTSGPGQGTEVELRVPTG